MNALAQRWPAAPREAAFRTPITACGLFHMLILYKIINNQFIAIDFQSDVIFSVQSAGHDSAVSAHGQPIARQTTSWQIPSPQLSVQMPLLTSLLPLLLSIAIVIWLCQ